MPPPLATPFDFFPPSAIKLGRLTSNIYDPITAHIDPTYPEDLLSANLIHHQFAKQRVNVTSDAAIGGSMILSQILNLGTRISTKSNNTLDVENVRTYRLSNSEDFFHCASAQQPVKNWLALKSTYAKPVYMITGYAIAGSLSQDNVTNTSTLVGAGIEPLNAVNRGEEGLTSGAMVLSGGVQSERNVTNKTKTSESTVFGVMYRKIKFRFMKKTHVIGENERQRIFGLGTRGAEPDDGSVIVEAELDDEVGADGGALVEDLKRDRVPFRKYQDEDGNVFFVLGHDTDEEVEGSDYDEHSDEEDSDLGDGWET